MVKLQFCMKMWLLRIKHSIDNVAAETSHQLTSGLCIILTFQNLIYPSLISGLPILKLCENPPITFSVILFRNKQTNASENNTAPQVAHVM